MVIDDFDVVSAIWFPAEAHAPLVIDANRKLTFSVTSEGLEPIPGDGSQCGEGRRCVQRLESSFGNRSKPFEGGRSFALRESLGRLVPERSNHASFTIAVLCVTSTIQPSR
jgi:hypothetical protein